MALEKHIEQTGATDLLALSQSLNKVIEQHEEAKNVAWRVRTPKTAYSAEDKVIVPGKSNFDKIMRCVTGGTTADGDFPGDYNALNIGDAITDGSVEWGIIELSTGGGGGEGGAVTSVNGKTGDVVLTAQKVGAEPNTHSTDGNAHKALFDAHRAEKASSTATGHVKVDGETITAAEDGTISAVGGMPIGAIFGYPGSVPPNGAYALNGQTIANCQTLYPAFYSWVTTSGARVEVAFKYENELTTTGVCGAFVVETSGSVRLPCLVDGTLWGADDSTVGDSLAAGLPNITGSFSGVGQAFDSDPITATLKGAFYRSNAANNPTAGVKIKNDGERDDVFGFDASRCSDVFGKSNTVQPPAIRVLWCIQVFNAATALSTQESAALAGLMQGKANASLDNINSNIDFIVEHWEDEAGNWYDIYRSGKVEQGGIQALDDTLASGEKAAMYVDLIVPMRVQPFYQCFLSWYYPVSESGELVASPAIAAFDKSRDSFGVFIYNRNSSTKLPADSNFEWRVIGKKATE